MGDKTQHNNIDINERIQTIKDKWFLIDPGFFMTICTHVIEINYGIDCAVATGNGRITINPEYFTDKSEVFLEDALKLECIRILLKHPYQRQLPNRAKNYLASNLVIANNYKFREMKVTDCRDFFGTCQFDRENMEMIYDNIKLPTNAGADGYKHINDGDSQSQNDSQQGEPGKSKKSGKKQDKDKSGSGSGDSGKDLNNLDDACSSLDDAFNRSQFWKEDELKVVEMNKLIDKITETDSWGSIPGNTVDIIKKSIESKFNYKALFQQFRSTVISSSCTLTRMKPNRRFNYDAMGSKRNFTTKILVAVDTSGSISNDELALVFNFINKFFKYGINTIDTIQFDCNICENSLMKLSKKIDSYEVHGRGGTDFNCVFEYVQERGHFYDGVIIVTDGFASAPNDKWLKTNYKNTKYLWCLNNERRWKAFTNLSNKWFKKFGGCTYVDKKDISYE